VWVNFPALSLAKIPDLGLAIQPLVPQVSLEVNGVNNWLCLQGLLRRIILLMDVPCREQGLAYNKHTVSVSYC
jgi:hypothetical protein